MIYSWNIDDTWTALAAAAAAMSCALPGTYLVLRRQSMLGDALSHTALPGLVAAFLFAHWLKAPGIWDAGQTGLTWHAVLFTGAVVAGLLTAFLTATVEKIGNVEASAALGVVYTSLFAFGLLLVSLYAHNLPHIDAECVLFGAVETCILDTLEGTSVPTALATNGAILLLNIVLILICFKELRLATFDPALAGSLGLNATIVHYLLMAFTSVTLVAAFESVGSILVITVMVVPAATAWLLTDRLNWMLGLSVVIAGLSAFLGQWFAITLPSVVFPALGFPMVDDTSTAGMIALSCGLLFALAFLFSPKKGIVAHSIRQSLLAFRIACEDLLGVLYRNEERPVSETEPQAPRTVTPSLYRRLLEWVAVIRLKRRGLVLKESAGCRLTDQGREEAQRLVRSHRLWESYMARHFPLPSDHLHETAHRVEHFLDQPMLDEIEQELDGPAQDPHGRSIPGRPKDVD